MFAVTFIHLDRVLQGTALLGPARSTPTGGNRDVLDQQMQPAYKTAVPEGAGRCADLNHSSKFRLDPLG